jgi:acyl carrier protein
MSSKIMQSRDLAERAAILARVQAMLVDVLMLDRSPEQLDPDAPLFGGGLALDSLDAVELVVAVEQAFQIRVVEDREAPPLALRSLNNLIDHILSTRT